MAVAPSCRFVHTPGIILEFVESQVLFECLVMFELLHTFQYNGVCSLASSYIR